MSSRLPCATLGQLRLPSCHVRFLRRSTCLLYSTQPPSVSASDSPAPPLLQKFKGDLKNAMKSKDTNRLNVLRGLLADISNASKTSSPVKTDMQVLTMLRKRAAATQAAAQEFAAANRQDLVDKEEAQKMVLEEYAGGVETVGEEEVRRIVEQVVLEFKDEGGKVDKGRLLKKLMGPQGVFDGRNVEKPLVVRITQEVAGK